MDIAQHGADHIPPYAGDTLSLFVYPSSYWSEPASYMGTGYWYIGENDRPTATDCNNDAVTARHRKSARPDGLAIPIFCHVQWFYNGAHSCKQQQNAGAGPVFGEEPFYCLLYICSLDHDYL